MCRTYHVTIYTPFLVIVLLSSSYQAAQNDSSSSSSSTTNSVDNESTDTNFTRVPTTTDLPDILVAENLSAVAINSSAIELNWILPNDTSLLSGFIIIWRKVSNNSISKYTTINKADQIVIGELDVWSEYEFIVATLMKDHDVDLRFNSSITARTGPSAPSQPRIYNVTATNSSISLKWEEPEDSNGPLDGYRVILRTEPNINFKNETFNRSYTSTSFGGLSPWTNYTIVLIAFNKWNNDELKAEDCDTVQTLYGVPSVPRDFNVVVKSASEILLTWIVPEYPNGPLDGFRISCHKSGDRDSIRNETLTGDDRSYLIDKLTPWTSYKFSIVAYNSDLTSNIANASNKTSADAPSVPRSFSARVKNSSAILLTWKAPANPNGPLDGFRINCSNSHGVLIKNITVSGNYDYYIIDELEPWTVYNFSIVAFNSEFLVSEEDAISERTAPDVPSVPLNFKNITYEPYQVRLEWQKPANPRGFIDGYIVICRTNTDVKQFNTTETLLVIENLRSWTIYNFSLSAYNIWKTKHLMSNEARIDVETKRPEFRKPSLKLHPYNSTTMNVVWEPSEMHDYNITGYNITWMISNECNESYVKSDQGSWRDVNSTELLITDLQSATIYAFYIYAYIDKNGEYLISDLNCITERTKDGLPVRPENLKCYESNSTSITIIWDEPSQYMGDIVNYTVNYYKFIQNSAEKNEKNKNTENKYLTLNDLEYYTKYEFKVSAWTNEGQGEWSESIICQTGSSEPNKVKDFKVSRLSSSSLNIIWSPPEPYPGPTNYTLMVYKVDSCDNERNKHVETLEKKGYYSDNAEFYDLEPYSKYIVYIRVSTEVGNSTSSLEAKTRPDRPGLVRNVRYKSDPTEINISWKIPEKPNGNIREFFISYVGEKGKRKRYGNKTITGFQLDLCKGEPNFSIKIDQLLPEYSYKFSICVNVNDTDGSFITGEVYTFNCVLPAGLPPLPETNITIVEKSKRQITFELRNDTFSDCMGDIVEYAVIVGTANDIGEPKQGQRELKKLPTWADFENNGDSKKYQATPIPWNPFNVDYDDSMKCKPVTESQYRMQCILGCDNRCKQSNRTYCNGPLKPGIHYGIKIRGYTKSGFAETPPVYINTEPEEAQKAKSGIIVAVVVSLLFLMLLVTGVFIYKKFGIINRFFGKTVMENSTETNDIGFMSVIAKSRPVKLSSFASHVSAMMADSALKFSQEFEELKSISPTHSCSAAQMQENKSKNRWINILPFDHSRVKLLPMDDEPGSDYINASYIPGFNSHREYIATQGPLPNTTDDMWRMIWEHGISMIVMLTQCVERGKTKCEQYWPPEKEESTYGDLKVQTTHESILSDYTIRSFNVSLGERQRVITQMHFTKWPDFGCPENTELLINFVRTVRDRMVENDPNPILVHCSAGVGRTGTFIAVNRLAQHIEMYDVVDVFHIVLDMRQHRTNMVQTEDQYIYIHECVRDLIQEKLARNNESYKNDQLYGNLGSPITTNI